MSAITTQPGAYGRASDGTALLVPHAIAAIFPAVQGPDLHALAEDIRQNGLQESITLYESKILDGHARYRACLQAQVVPHFRQYEGDNALAFVISANLRRRHLSEGQRTMIAANIEGFRHGGDRRSSDQGAKLHLDRDKAAKLLNVSTRSIANAAIVRDRGIPELQRAVLQGQVTVSPAATFARQEACDQQRWIEKNIDVRRAVRAFRSQGAAKGPYQDLLASIGATEKLMRHSVTKIVAEIPDEQRRSMAALIERFKSFFTGLDAETRKSTSGEVNGTGDDRAQIRALLAKARKSFGRANRIGIMQAVIPKLTVAQLEILRAGEFGPAAKIAAERTRGQTKSGSS